MALPSLLALFQQGQWYPGVEWEECRQHLKVGEPPPLLCPSENISGVFCPVLGSSMQERHGATGEGPAEGCEEDGGSGTSVMRREWRSWVCLVWRSLRRYFFNPLKYLLGAKRIGRGCWRPVPGRAAMPTHKAPARGCGPQRAGPAPLPGHARPPLPPWRARWEGCSAPRHRGRRRRRGRPGRPASSHRPRGPATPTTRWWTSWKRPSR